MSSNETSLLPYESRPQWLTNLLRMFGVLSVQQEELNGINDDNSKTSQLNNKQSVDVKIDEKVVTNSEQLYDTDQEIDTYLKTLDPKHWKEQDHYKVLGLSKLRYNSTESEIKKSYRKIVLRHHPDKRHGANSGDKEDDYYSCITKAHALLSDPVTRRSYDSVDPTVDDSIVNATPYNKNHFFEVFPQVFERNAKWSNKTPVPLLGDEHSTYDEVNEFYDFWYNFDSWREFSYLDEEDKEKGENREERRWMEKQNKQARQQRKKEEMQRIRQLVDNAYQCDPRVVKFKEDEKKRKLEQKQARQASIQAKKQEEERLQREKEERELAHKKQLEEAEKQRREEERKQKEAIKKKSRNLAKQLGELMKQNNYFADDNDDDVKLENMREWDKLCKLYTLDQLESFAQSFKALSTTQERKSFFLSSIEQLNKQLEDERVKLANAASSLSGGGGGGGDTTKTSSSKKNWSYDDIQILIKAVKLFPPGTPNRWTVIANFINDKSTSGVTRNHRDALEKAKELQSSGQSQHLKEEVNKNAFNKLANQAINNVTKCKIAEVEKPDNTPSERYDAPKSILEVNDNPWTNEEQQLLEQAMKTYPASLGVERWNLIANCIPDRSRADCIKRYKHLVELVKAKNAAKANAKK